MLVVVKGGFALAQLFLSAFPHPHRYAHRGALKSKGFPEFPLQISAVAGV